MEDLGAPVSKPVDGAKVQQAQEVLRETVRAAGNPPPGNRPRKALAEAQQALTDALDLLDQATA